MNNIGIKVKAPKEQCEDPHCPFHGSLVLRGRTFTGVVISSKMHKTAIIEWTRRALIPKYERYEMKRTKVSVHNPNCINAKEGDRVKIMECRKLSKTKNFVIIENLGKEFLFEDRMLAREEAKVKEKPKKKLDEKKEISESAAEGEE